MLLIAATLTLGLLSSCGSDDNGPSDSIQSFTADNVVGSWMITEVDGDSFKSFKKGAVLTFNSNGTCSTGFYMEDAYKIQDGKIYTYYAETDEPMYIYTLVSGDASNLTVRVGGTLDESDMSITIKLQKVSSSVESQRIHFMSDTINIKYGASKLIDTDKPLGSVQLSISDPFVSTISVNGTEATLNAVHVGETKLYLKQTLDGRDYNDSCLVIVSPKTSAYGFVLEKLGATKKEVMSANDEYYQMGPSVGGFDGVNYSSGHKGDYYYEFDSNDKLVAIKVKLGRSRYSYDDVVESLLERYEYESGSQNVKWYKHEDVMMVRLEKTASEIFIWFAKDPEVMYKYFPW
ncbi:hypothetical protein PRBRB14_21780 [Hallella multisaccharivorax DSM 17128]|nr:hypothetical protein PRBRB14_21780 [Hallella multisaccharivorax DSM 17128]